MCGADALVREKSESKIQVAGRRAPPFITSNQ